MHEAINPALEPEAPNEDETAPVELFKLEEGKHLLKH